MNSRNTFMKKLFISIIALTCALTGYSIESSDTTARSFSEIIAMETPSKSNYDYYNSEHEIWGHNYYLNISYNMTKFSSEEFPSTTGGFYNKFENQFGVGLQWGRTFNFNKNPLGSVLFIGLDFTWMDINFNKYKKTGTPAAYTEGEQTKNLPWHNEKMTLGYAMAAGPAFTLYPFTSLHKKGSDKIRLSVYFHVGYGIEGAIIRNVYQSDKWAWGNGLNTAFGASLSWDHIGVGYEFRNDGSLKFKTSDTAFDTGKLKVKEETSRLYLQFRF